MDLHYTKQDVSKLVKGTDYKSAPAGENIWIEVGYYSDFRLINLNGAVILKGALSKGLNSIETPTIDGVYVLEVQTNKNTIREKVIVRHTH